MRQSESIAKLAPALVKAISQMGGVGKSGNNTFDRYTYAKLEDYVRASAPILAANGLCVLSGVPAIVPLDDRTTSKGGKEHAVRVGVTMRIVHESGEWIEADSAGEGQDRADKALYKAITGARKYGLASLLCLATTDDPEGDDKVGNTPPPAQRETPKPNGNGAAQKPKVAFTSRLIAWTGLKPEDRSSIGDAANAVARAGGFDSAAGLDDKQYGKLATFCEVQMKQGVDFMEWANAHTSGASS
jgi:hypothetical protein